MYDNNPPAYNGAAGSGMIEQMYPELYRSLMPIILDVTRSIDTSQLTQSDLDMMIEEVLRRSGLVNFPDDGMNTAFDETAPAFAPRGWGGYRGGWGRERGWGMDGYRGRGWRRGGSLLPDIARGLLLWQLFGGLIPNI